MTVGTSCTIISLMLYINICDILITVPCYEWAIFLIHYYISLTVYTEICLIILCSVASCSLQMFNWPSQCNMDYSFHYVDIDAIQTLAFRCRHDNETVFKQFAIDTASPMYIPRESIIFIGLMGFQNGYYISYCLSRVGKRETHFLMIMAAVLNKNYSRKKT